MRSDKEQSAWIICRCLFGVSDLASVCCCQTLQHFVIFLFTVWSVGGDNTFFTDQREMRSHQSTKACMHVRVWVFYKCICLCVWIMYPSFAAPLVSMGGVTKSYFLSGARTDVPPTAAPPQSQIHLEEESLKNVPCMHFQLKHFPCACIIFSQLPLKKSLSAFNENKQLVPVSPCVMISLWCRHPGDRGSLIFGCFRPNQQPCQIPLAIRSGG